MYTPSSQNNYCWGVTRRDFLSALSAAPACLDRTPVYTDKRNLLFYMDAAGHVKPVRSPEDWRQRAEHISCNMERVMGPLPQKSTEPIDVQVKEEIRLERYTRQRVTYVP